MDWYLLRDTYIRSTVFLPMPNKASLHPNIHLRFVLVGSYSCLTSTCSRLFYADKEVLYLFRKSFETSDSVGVVINKAND